MTLVERLRAAGCVFAEQEAALLLGEAPDAAVLEAWVRRRVGGEPLETILGWAELDGVRVTVRHGVFVPRRRSLLLVREAAAHLGDGAGRVLVDLCCGSGALGLLTARRTPGLQVHAVDLDAAAVACAADNLAPVGGVAYRGDLDAPLPNRLRGAVDVLVANAPYVPTGAIGSMPPEARDHEPAVALDGGPDGLDMLHAVLALAPRWLAPTGIVAVECSRAQAPQVAQRAARAGLRPRIVTDAALDATAVVAQAGSIEG